MADVLTEFTLTEPLRSHDGDITVLKLKAPRARSFIKHGMPFTVKRTEAEDGMVTVEHDFNPKAMLAFVSDMSGVDDLILQGLNGYDTYNLFFAVLTLIGNPPKPNA